MSSVIPVSGTLEERQKIHQSIVKGFKHVATFNTTEFYNQEKDGVTNNKKSLIVVGGKLKSVSFGSDEKIPDGWHGPKRYLSSDFLVVLDESDAFIYKIRNMAPIHIAEAGAIKAFMSFFTAVVVTIITIALSIWQGFGWWSILPGLIAGLGVVLYFGFVEYPLRASIAALRVASTIWKKIYFEGKSRDLYRDIVFHLSESSEYTLRLPCKILYRLI